MSSRRILQVLPDTDASDANLSAVELHAALAGAGVEVRTLALGPGRSGELADEVPVIAPSRRSVAAHTQLHAEQRWADLVLLRGGDVASVAALAHIVTPCVVVLWDEPQRWADGARVPARVRRLASRCAAVVVGWDAAAGTTCDAVGIDRGRVSVILPTLAAAPAGVAESARTAARTAARHQLGVDDDRLVVRVLADNSHRSPSGSRASDRVSLDELRSRLGSSASVLHAPDDVELARAATDVVVVLDGRGGPSPELLRCMLLGAVAVTPAWPALADVVDDGETGRTFGLEVTTGRIADELLALAAGPVARHALAAAGAERVAERCLAEAALPRWLDTLRSALPSRP